MAFLRVQKKESGNYYMVVENHRRGEKVVQKVLEYLGRDPDPKRLKRALKYWRVKPAEGRRRMR